MKFIDQGYQYAVYDLGVGRVVKKPRSVCVTMYHMSRVYRRHGSSMMDAFARAVRFVGISKKTTHHIREKLSACRDAPDALSVVPQLSSMLGNPVFRKGIEYEQDKVDTLEKYFLGHALDENKARIDAYIELCFTLWKYSIHDYIYKLKSNYGVGMHGGVILLDFNELVFSREEALESIEKQHWLGSTFYKKWPEGALKTYYTETMAKHITRNNLSAYWGLKEG